MTVKELTEQCPFEIVHLGNPDAVLTEPYCCDLLSIAMGNAPAGSAWCTVMSNMNTLAVAALAEASCVILCNNVSVGDNKSSPDSCVKCYTMFLPFLLIKIDVFS